VREVIKEAYRLIDVIPSDVNPDGILEEFLPLTKGQYPVFNKYPKFIVDYQVQERERIRQEEVDYLRQRYVCLLRYNHKHIQFNQKDIFRLICIKLSIKRALH